MTKSEAMLPDQGVMPYAAEVVSTPVHIEIDWERRTNFNRLLERTCAGLGYIPLTRDVGAGIAEPKVIGQGLYIDVSDRRYRNAEQLYEGVVFPSREFKFIARNPRDLAKHTKSGTREANKTLSDRDEAYQKVGRSAGHVLETQITRLTRYAATMSEKRLRLLSLVRDIDPPLGVVHYKAKNLEIVRNEVDEAIHETAEVATINLNFDTTAVRGLHKVIRYNLYGSSDQERRMAYWRRYIVMTGKHTRAKLNAATTSKIACERELTIYAPFLNNT